MSHAIAWHDVIVSEIEKMRAEMSAKGEVIPDYMYEMWNEEHECYVAKMAKLKYMLEIAKK